MKFFWFFIVAFFGTIAADAQEACPEYNTLIHQADSFFSRNDYLPALFKYNSAKTCSPSKRSEIDKKINLLFKKIESERMRAQDEEKQVSKMLAKVRAAERAQYLSDSNRIVDRFKSNNNSWIKYISQEEQKTLFDSVVELGRHGNMLVADSLGSCYNLFIVSKQNEDAYVYYSEEDSAMVNMARLRTDKTDALRFYRVSSLDLLYNTAWTTIRDAQDLLPSMTRPGFEQKFTMAAAAMYDRRMASFRSYWLPDTVMTIPDNIFARACTDNKNFVWANSDYTDYKKVQVRFRNLSLIDFRITTDSLVSLSDTGRFFGLQAADADFHYKLGKAIDYALKKNKIDYQTEVYATPAVYKLIDNRGQVQQDFSSESGFFFSPDTRYMATWKGGTELALYSMRARKFVPLPYSSSSSTESFAADSKSIAYYNMATKMIYFSDLDGQLLKQIPGKLTGIDSITNIDFTGGDRFLKVNNDDTICLFDIKNKKTVFLFKTAFIRDIVGSPNGQDFLITCNTKISISGNVYTGFLTFVTDADLNIKTKLYSPCENFFFTPDGQFIIGYGDNALMRWTVNRTEPPSSNLRGCLPIAELIDHACIPYDRLPFIDNARLIEASARKYRLTGDNETDPILKATDYLHCRDLFNRLAEGKAKNILRERIPFFYDWMNYMENKLEYRNFSQQFLREAQAVVIFDSLTNTADSAYPEHLYFSANWHLFLADLYDSLHRYEDGYAAEIWKELPLRQRVFAMDPDNRDNRIYFANVLSNLFRISDSVAWKQLVAGQYAERIYEMSRVVKFYKSNMNSLPDSFGVKQLYINSLMELAPSYLYIYAREPGNHPNVLDSALNYADIGLAMTSRRYDSARLLIIKARAYLLQDSGYSKALQLYTLVKAEYPEMEAGGMEQQLINLKGAGARNPGDIDEIIKFLSNVDANNIRQPSNENRHDIH
jgi:hypothetical protein